jgi:hypothetical protein
LLAAVHKRLESRNGDEVQSTLKELGMEYYSFTAVREAYPDAFGQIGLRVSRQALS